jgi:hypothetical protein
MTIYTAVQAVRAEVPLHPGLHILIVSNPTDTRRDVHLAHDSFRAVLYLYSVVQWKRRPLGPIGDTVKQALLNVGDHIDDYFAECHRNDE